jgi:hypothetical protein
LYCIAMALLLLPPPSAHCCLPPSEKEEGRENVALVDNEPPHDVECHFRFDINGRGNNEEDDDGRAPSTIF